MYLGAHVLLPEGFDSHPDAHYPLVIFHGHFPEDFGGFRETPPDPNLKPEYSERFHLEGYNRTQQEYAYKFYQEWTGPNFPRFLIVEIQHANPYYDDSYAVNSANLGPYGDAITYELIPEIEKQFRGIGKGWARFLYGGSTGGWEALAAQMFYPDEYNGAWAACPDPIDFRALHRGEHLRARRTPTTPTRSGNTCRGPANATISASWPPPLKTQTDGTRVGNEQSFRRTVGHLASGLFTGRHRRLSQTDLGQSDRQDRSVSGRATGANTTTSATS